MKLLHSSDSGGGSADDEGGTDARPATGEKPTGAHVRPAKHRTCQYGHVEADGDGHCTERHLILPL